MLYACYEFSRGLHREPKDWRDFFDFLKFSETRNMLKEAALETARAKSGAGNG